MIRPLSLALTCMVAVVIVACGGTPPATNEERSPGEMAFRRSCQSCHSLPRPSMKSAEEWPALVERYGARANLTDEKIRAITEYLIASTDK